MKVEHFIIAQNSSVDRDTNLMSVFCFLEDLNIQTQENQPPFSAQSIIVLKREDEEGAIEGKCTFSVVSPKGSRLISTQVPFKFREDHIRQRIRVNFQIPLPEAGDYTFIAEGSNEMPRKSEQSIRIQFVDRTEEGKPESGQLN